MFAFMNRNGHYMKYFNFPLVAMGLRMAIRLVDFENSLEVIGRDEFLVLIFMNTFGIIGNVIVK